MKNRQRRPDFIPRSAFIPRAQIAAVADLRTVRDHRALGLRCGARGVEDHRGILRLHRIDAAVDLGIRCFIAQRQRRRRAEQIGRTLAFKANHRAQHRRFIQLQRSGIARLRQRGERGDEPIAKVERIGHPPGGDQHDQISILHQIAQLIGLIPRIHRHRDRAGHHRSEKHFHKFGACGEQNANMLPRLHAHGDQRLRPAARALPKRAIR